MIQKKKQVTTRIQCGKPVVRECRGPTKGLVQISMKKRKTPTDLMTKSPNSLTLNVNFVNEKCNPKKKILLGRQPHHTEKTENEEKS